MNTEVAHAIVFHLRDGDQYGNRVGCTFSTQQAGGWEAACHEKLTLALLLLDRRYQMPVDLRPNQRERAPVSLLSLNGFSPLKN